MTKHYCDRCGKEIDLHTAQTVVLYQVMLGYNNPGQAVNRPPPAAKADLCNECVAWLKANWPFKGNWDRVLPGDEIRRTLYAPYKGGQLDQPVAETTGG